MKLSEMQKKERTISVDFDGEPVEIVYLANVITPTFLSDKPEVVDQIRRAVVRWDITGDDGKPLPVADTVDDVSIMFLMKVIAAITDDIRVSSEEKKG